MGQGIASSLPLVCRPSQAVFPITPTGGETFRSQACGEQAGQTVRDGQDNDWGTESGEPAPLHGLLADTPVATPGGWRRAIDLRAGDAVLSFEHGPQRIERLEQSLIITPAKRLVRLPAWALDNRADLVLLPEQMVLIEADLAEALYGDPFALIPAAALEGWRGIACLPPVPELVVVRLTFSVPEVIYASRGLLLACQVSEATSVLPLPDPLLDPVPYTLAQARHLVACLMAEDLGGALRAPHPPQAAAF
jgi:Hint domain